MNQTIFPRLSLDLNVIDWNNYIHLKTPWENHCGVWFKREDYFAPLGYGGPNGSKMRQLIWFINRHRTGKKRIVTGASVQSPQLSMSAIVGAHYGLPCTQVVYSKPTTLMSHVNPRVAAGFGATFDFARGPYNPIIQSRVRELETDATLTVEYGITCPPEKYGEVGLKTFHSVGAQQVNNIPQDVKRLIIPAGSCNTLVSVLLGLYRNDFANVEELLIIGIGPDKREWVENRLALLGVVRPPSINVRYHSLHDTGYSRYEEKFRGESYEGIHFHPTYEAKMWRWLRENPDQIPGFGDDSWGFWIVGSSPQLSVIEPFFTHKELDRE